MKQIIGLSVAVILSLASTQAYAQAKIPITITDLGILPGGTGSMASAINDSGEVVGGADVPSGDVHAFLWTAKGGMQDIGGLPGANGTHGSGINIQGQVVGYSGQLDRTTGQWAANWPRAFLWTANQGMLELPKLPGSGFDAAFAINNQGKIVGQSAARAVIWQKK
jgi:probable HAF family extracellular repeat protein